MILDESDVAQLRAIDEGEMVDTCHITRPGDSEPVFNEDTMQYDDPPPVTVYEGPCAFLAGSIAGVTPAELAGQDLDVAHLVLRLPLDGTEKVRRNQTVRCTAALRDQGNVGRDFRVARSPLPNTVSTRREVLLEVLD